MKEILPYHKYLENNNRNNNSWLTCVVLQCSPKMTLAKGSDSPDASEPISDRAWYMCARSWNTCSWSGHYYYYIPDLRAFSRCEDVAKDRNTWGTVGTVGNGDPMHEVCIQQSIPRAWNNKSEGIGRSRHKNNSKGVVWNMEGRNVGRGMWEGRGEVPNKV